MTTESINARLSRLEDDVAELRKDLRADVKGLHEKVDSILAAVAAMSKGQGMEAVQMQGELDAVKSHLCPKPGACVDLSKRMENMELNYSNLHDMVQQFKGAYKAGRAFWIGVGACVSVGLWVAKEWLMGKN